MRLHRYEGSKGARDSVPTVSLSVDEEAALESRPTANAMRAVGSEPSVEPSAKGRASESSTPIARGRAAASGKPKAAMRVVEPSSPKATTRAGQGRRTRVDIPAVGSSAHSPRPRRKVMALQAVDLETAPTRAKVKRRTSAPVSAAEPPPPTADRVRAVGLRPTTGPQRARKDSRRVTVSLDAAPPSQTSRPSGSHPVVSSLRAIDTRRTTASLRAIDSRRTTTSLPALDSRAFDDGAGSAQPLAAVFGDGAREEVFDHDQLQRAALQLQQLTHREPQSIEAAEAFVRVSVDLGRHGQAGVELLRLAVLYADAGRLAEALASIEHARRLDPSCLLRHRLAPLVFRLGPQGRAPCEQAIQAHLAAARLDAARDLLALLVEAQPGEIELRHRLAKTELLLGRTSTALVHLRMVVERYRGEQRVAQLVPAAEELLRHGGPDPELLWELTLIYLQADLQDRALDKLELLHRLMPGDLEIVERMANLQARLGRLAAVQRTLRRLVRGMREAEVGTHQIRELLERARNWSDAQEHHDYVDTLIRKMLPPRRCDEGRSVVTRSAEPSEDKVVATPAALRLLLS